MTYHKWQRKSSGCEKQGFTLIELLVVIRMIALLIALLLPALAKARQTAQSLQCASNQRQLAIAILTYSDEHRQWLPYRYNSGNPNANWGTDQPWAGGVQRVGASTDPGATDLERSGTLDYNPNLASGTVWVCPLAIREKTEPALPSVESWSVTYAMPRQIVGSAGEAGSFPAYRGWQGSGWNLSDRRPVRVELLRSNNILLGDGGFSLNAGMFRPNPEREISYQFSSGHVPPYAVDPTHGAHNDGVALLPGTGVGPTYTPKLHNLAVNLTNIDGSVFKVNRWHTGELERRFARP